MLANVDQKAIEVYLLTPINNGTQYRLQLESMVFLNDIPYKLSYQELELERLLYVITIDPSGLYELNIENPE